ncbi:uncharacterized protein BDW43DRAFT_278994 [Aspergillus alliaceus]|uniref:uncharacterized protein n=1 Tax=Petromyces alliaceus TaxID=209559 RepID=UPI0012A497B1|nr:uncharacterized protein BDW43DRAFT_278994 [Aspergillus alliaceus]KAB8232573.1 hypothetical protein BDW43DRAFT_278994 [Aspergillus alliaceus]
MPVPPGPCSRPLCAIHWLLYLASVEHTTSAAKKLKVSITHNVQPQALFLAQCCMLDYSYPSIHALAPFLQSHSKYLTHPISKCGGVMNLCCLLYLHYEYL